jgi:glycosyltransferase involved in cell wall biosynthesis
MSIVVHSSTSDLSGSVPRAVFGLPAYNHGHKLRQTLNSLLNQTLPNFRLIISDDGSTDATSAILKEYAARDDRIIQTRTPRRLGYIGNARRCFELAREQFPETEYFAWASDHDIWHPRWLEVLALALDQQPDAAIACPNVYRIDAVGEIIATKAVRCTTGSRALSARRFARIFDEITPGDMIYGLIRADMLEKAGALSWHLMPDRLTLMLLSFYGSVLSVPEYLWYRRYRGLASLHRQMQSSFLDKPPGYLHFPWWLTHAAHVFNKFVVSPRPVEPIGRWSGAGYSLLYALLGAQYVFVRRFVHPLKRMLRALAPTCYAFLKTKCRRAQRPVRS